MAMDLGKQVGPLPLGAWIVVVGGGLGIAWYTKRSQVPTEPSIDTGGQAGVGDGSVGGWTPTSPNTGTTDTTGTAPTTNEEWAYKAKQHLIAQGYPATTVQSAIDKYINGITPSVQEYTMVGLALAKIGPLPQSLPTGPVEPTKPASPYDTPGTPAAGSRRGYGWVKAVSGDTLKKLGDKWGKTLPEMYLFNGAVAVVPGRWYKIRWSSNPFMGYNGK